MKRLKRIVTLLLMLIFLLFQSLPTYAWVTAEGESSNISSFKNAYAINAFLQGWIIYWIDEDSSIVSDVALVSTASIINQFISATYDCIQTRYCGASPSYPMDISSLGMPFPYSDPVSNAPAVKAWIKANQVDLVDMLNATEDIKTCKEEDKYFFIAEPVYMFSLFSNVEGVPKKTIVGTTYQYSNFILNNLLGTADYPSTATLFGASASRGLTEYGWWGTCKYTNGLFGTFECVGNDYLKHLGKIGISTAGEDYFNKDFANHPLNFSELANASVGLGIVIMSNSDKGEMPTGELITRPYVGKVVPDTWTYNYAEGFNLDKYNDPKGRIPSGEVITNGIDVDTWYCDYSIIKHSAEAKGEGNLKRKVKVEYNIHWQMVDSYKSVERGAFYGDYSNKGLTEDQVEDFCSQDFVYEPNVVKISKGRYKVEYYGISDYEQTYSTYVTRESYYYEIETYGVYTFNKAVITCESESGISAYTGQEIIYNGNYKVSYNMKKTAKVVHYPTDTYGIDIYANDYEDGKHIAEERKLEDADDFIVQNDYLEVGGKIFVSNEQGQHGKEYVKLATYDFPQTGTGMYETSVTIPFTCPNDYYYTSATYTYKSLTEKNRGVTIQRNAPETHGSNTASIDERIHANYRMNEPIFVHTPVVTRVNTSGSTDVQLVSSKVNDVMVDYQLRLDNQYTFEFDIETHLNLLGYSLNGYAWDYAKYVKKAQVLFPFDVAIISNPSGEDVYTYYKADTWIDVDYLVPTTYYIPSYAVETDYAEIYFRTIAYNIDEYLSEEEYASLEQETHNLIPSNYVSYTKTAVQLSGYVYDLTVVGANDGVQLEFKDKLEPVTLAKQKKEFRAGTRNRLGNDLVRFSLDSLLTNDWDVKYTLPFANGSNLYSNIAGTLGKGTKLAFSVKTITNCWNKEDELVIKPRLRYVSADGIEYDYDDTKIYYMAGGENFIEVGSDKDAVMDINKTLTIPTKLTSPLFSGSFNEKEIERTLGLYNRINKTEYLPELGVWNVETNNGSGTNNYSHVGLITIPSTLKLYSGDEEDLSFNYNNEGINVVRLDDTSRHIDVGNSSFDSIMSSNGEQVALNTTELMYASMQTWYGEWVLPPNVYIAFTSDVEQYGDYNYDGVIDLNDYADYKWANEEGLSDLDPIWQKAGYLVLNFEITVRKNGEDYLTYYSNKDTFTGGAETVHGQNMMKVENAKASFNEIVYVGGVADVPVTLQTGDIAIFDMLTSTHDYFDVGVGWTN